MKTLETQVSEHVAATRFEDLPQSAIDAAKKSILDTIGVMLAATTLGEGCDAIAAFAQACGGKGESSVIGYGNRLPAPLAALVNGGLAHALDYDDGHDRAKCHPAGASFPASFALAQRQGASGRQLITAMAVGGDFTARLAMSMDLGPGSHGWLGSAIYSHFGGTAAAGNMLGLSPAQMAHAFGVAFCQTAGSREMGEDCAYRGVRDGFAQKVGVASALLAQRGLTGPGAFLEGRAGLYNQYFKGKYTRERLIDGLGQRFEGGNVSYKLWPVCRLIHKYIQSLLSLIEEHHLSAEDVEAVTVVVSDWGKVLSEPRPARIRPTTVMGAKDSMQFILGLVLVHKSVRMEHFHPDRLREPTVVDAARKVQYRHDPGLDPAAMSPGDVEIRTRDGRVLHRVTDLVYGTPESPIAMSGLEDKFFDCLQYAKTPVSPDRARRLIDTVGNLENEQSVDGLAV